MRASPQHLHELPAEIHEGVILAFADAIQSIFYVAAALEAVVAAGRVAAAPESAESET